MSISMRRRNTTGKYVISWVDAGTAFQIHDRDLVIPILEKYFNMSKYKSFLRQLQAYGFQRATPNPSTDEEVAAAADRAANAAIAAGTNMGTTTTTTTNDGNQGGDRKQLALPPPSKPYSKSRPRLKATHKGKWHHTLFRRDKMNLCNKMTRDGKEKTRKKKGKSSAAFTAALLGGRHRGATAAAALALAEQHEQQFLTAPLGGPQPIASKAEQNKDTSETLQLPPQHGQHHPALSGMTPSSMEEERHLLQRQLQQRLENQKFLHQDFNQYQQHQHQQLHASQQLGGFPPGSFGATIMAQAGSAAPSSSQRGGGGVPPVPSSNPSVGIGGTPDIDEFSAERFLANYAAKQAKQEEEHRRRQLLQHQFDQMKQQQMIALILAERAKREQHALPQQQQQAAIPVGKQTDSSSPLLGSINYNDIATNKKQKTSELSSPSSSTLASSVANDSTTATTVASSTAATNTNSSGVRVGTTVPSAKPSFDPVSVATNDLYAAELAVAERRQRLVLIQRQQQESEYQAALQMRDHQQRIQQAHALAELAPHLPTNAFEDELLRLRKAVMAGDKSSLGPGAAPAAAAAPPLSDLVSTDSATTAPVLASMLLDHHNHTTKFTANQQQEEQEKMVLAARLQEIERLRKSDEIQTVLAAAAAGGSPSSPATLHLQRLLEGAKAKQAGGSFTGHTPPFSAASIASDSTLASLLGSVTAGVGGRALSAGPTSSSLRGLGLSPALLDLYAKSASRTISQTSAPSSAPKDVTAKSGSSSLGAMEMEAAKALLNIPGCVTQGPSSAKVIDKSTAGCWQLVPPQQFNPETNLSHQLPTSVLSTSTSNNLSFGQYRKLAQMMSPPREMRIPENWNAINEQMYLVVEPETARVAAIRAAAMEAERDAANKPPVSEVTTVVSNSGSTTASGDGLSSGTSSSSETLSGQHQKDAIV